MNRKTIGLAVAGLLWVMGAGVAMAETAHRIGGGLTYWFKTDDIEVPESSGNGAAWFVAYKFVPPGLVRFQADLQLMPDRFMGAAKEVFAPEAAVVIGYGVYAGVGAGWYLDTDDGFADNPFYTLRAGLDMMILPALRADVFLKYRFESWDELDKGNDADTIEVGVALLLEI